MELKKPIVFETTFTIYTASEIKGEGGSGRIYKAVDESEKVYAIKLLNRDKATKEKVKRFNNELQFGLRNQHRNIVTVIDHGIYKDGKGTSLFYVMPFYNSSLRHLLISGIVSSKILLYYSQILDGVEAAHLQKVIHRDIKPENILYDSHADNLLIADFGIAHFEEEDLFTAVDTKDSSRLANFQYAAPEQRGRGLEVDRRADIFALGLILNEMFTGKVPQGTGYKNIGGISPDYRYLDELILEMLRQSPSERPSTIEVIKNLLIAKKNEFITQQRVSNLTRTIIKASDIDDPLIIDPPRLVDADWIKGLLTLKLSCQVNPKWVWALQNMGSYHSAYGKDPLAFRISGNIASINAEEREVQNIIDHFNKWLPMANSVYAQKIRQEMREDEERRRQEIQRQLKEEETRLRVLKNIKL